MNNVQPGSLERTSAFPLSHNIVGAAVVYLVQGLGYATIMTSLPSFSTKWSLGEMTVSLVLLVTVLLAAVGSVVANAVAVRASSRAAVVWGLSVEAAALFTVAIAPALPVFFGAVFVFGVGLGMVDAAQNMQGVRVEKRAGKPLLGRFYAVATAATIGGALLVSASIALHGSVFMALATVAVLDVVGALVASRTLEVRDTVTGGPAAQGHAAGTLGAEVDGASGVGSAATAEVATADVGATGATGPAAIDRGKIRFAIYAAVAMIVFLAYVMDSSVSAWSTMYMQEGLGAAASIAPFAYAVYQGAVLLARLVTDALEQRIGLTMLAKIAIIVGALGSVVVALVPAVWAAILGFGLTGLAAGALVPLAFSAAGNLLPGRSDEIIARVNLFNYFGALIGAVMLGLIAQGRGLGLAFLIPGIGLLLALPLVRSLARSPESAGEPAHTAESAEAKPNHV